MTNNRRKGNTAERELAKILEEKTGVEYRRTPLSGGLDWKGDIQKVNDNEEIMDHIVNDIHWECKHAKNIRIKEWLVQAMEDCPDDMLPVVAHKLSRLHRNKSYWYVYLKLEDFLDMLNLAI